MDTPSADVDNRSSPARNITLGTGFYAEEDGRRWIGDSAELMILHMTAPSVLRFRLTCTAAEYYNRFPFYTIIYLNELPVLSLHFSASGQTQEVDLRLDPMEADLAVRIENGSSFVPAEVSDSADIRSLSLIFSDLSFNDKIPLSEHDVPNTWDETFAITPEVEIQILKHQNTRLRTELNQKATWVPPGHFYSPIPDLSEIRKRQNEIFNLPSDIPGIDLNDEGQLNVLNSFRHPYSEHPFADNKREGLRYYFVNPNFSYMDALVLYCMLRTTKPVKVIEIGSGFSSCVTLDTNEFFFNNSIDLTFIEPYPDLFLSLIKTSDNKQIRLIPRQLQEVDPEIFSTLSEGDVLFVDSTHVSKAGSDVNYIMFKILPMLKKGVLVHLHDIFYPFEYPKNWIFEGRAWNEAYLLHAFLQFNDSFRIQFFNSYLAYRYEDRLEKVMPLALKNTGGSIWLEKTVEVQK